jgi:hypothetical protein
VSPIQGIRIRGAITTHRLDHPIGSKLPSSMCMKIHRHGLENFSMLFDAAGKRGGTVLIRRKSNSSDWAPGHHE